MFQNLSLKGFTWPKEPVLYLTLIAAVLTTVAAALTGDLSWVQAVEAVIILVGGFIARGQVSPISQL